MFGPRSLMQWPRKQELFQVPNPDDVATDPQNAGAIVTRKLSLTASVSEEPLWTGSGVK